MLYGTASGNGQCPSVVFRLSPNVNGSWSESSLYTFTGFSDGGSPMGSLIFDSAGNLYGTTAFGGTLSGYCLYGGCGVVFELSPSTGGSWTENVLYTFTGLPDGEEPVANLTFDAAGNLYGTMQFGGLQNFACPITGCGTVFKLTPAGGSWTESIVHSFAGPLSDGYEPTSGVILDSAGTIYGTTSVGGVNGNQYSNGGTVFRITP
jgi:hypothetical protein